MRALSIVCVVFIAISVAFATNSNSHGKSKLDQTKRFLLSDSEEQLVNAGFNAAKDLTDKLDVMDFAGTLGKVIGAASKFFGALGPFFGAILSFFGGPSPEYLLIKELYKDVDNRFDRVDVQFSHLRKQINFVTTKIHFRELESNIVAVETQLSSIALSTNHASYVYETNEYIKTFDRSYDSTGVRLYDGIVNGGLLTGGIFGEFMTYSNYDRRATQKFMLGTLNLLIKAVRLEMVYNQLQGDPSQDRKQHEWIGRLNEVKAKMQAIDHAIINEYQRQLTREVNEYALFKTVHAMTNEKFAEILFSNVTTKYYWRYWLVIVANVQGGDRFVNHACDLNQHDNNGRSIVVASVPKTKKHISYSDLTKLTLFSAGGHQHHLHYGCKDANIAFQELPSAARSHCSPYAAAGVHCTQNSDVHVHYDHERYREYVPHGTNRAYLFG